MDDTESTRRVFNGVLAETNMDRIVERAITSLVERGRMTSQEAAVKRAELRQAQDAARDRAELRQGADKAQMEGEG